MQPEQSIEPTLPGHPPVSRVANGHDSAPIEAIPDTSTSASAALPVANTPVKVQPAPERSALGSWFSRNRWFTHEPFTYAAYQFTRAGFATVAYGFMMALGHHVFNLFNVWGQKAGLTAKGIEEFGKQGGVLGLEKLANTSKATEVELYRAGTKGVLGRGLMRLGNSPMNAAVQIALGFTLFRFVGGIVKNVRDRVINDRNTEQETIHETKNWWQTVKETARINWTAELTATPIAAIVLGFMNAAYTPPAPHFAPNRVAPGAQRLPFWKRAHEVVLSPKAKLVQNSMVWTFSYSLFFLLAECLFKDKQIQRGQWKGHPNSLKNGPDDVVGGPGAIRYITPEDDPAKPQHLPVSNDLAEAGLFKAVDTKTGDAKKDDSHAKDTHEKLRYPELTGEPSWGRFIFRRVLPVCVGISAYAALKRVGYLAAGGPMQPITMEKYEKELGRKGAPLIEKLINNGKFYLENARREGLATVMFGSVWWATDAGGDLYDKFVQKLQHPKNAVPLNDNQQKHHAELLARLNEKYQGQGRVA